MKNTIALDDRLSRLSPVQAANLLKPDGAALLREGGSYEIDIDNQVLLDKNNLKLKLADANIHFFLDPAKPRRISWQCSCGIPRCVHAGAALSLVLEEKTLLGLAKAPPEAISLGPLSEEELLTQAIAERQLRADSEKMRVHSSDPENLWSDYRITNLASGKTYRVALRGWQPGESYCTCPDFRKNTLGTCKHILHTSQKIARRFPASVRNQPYVQQQLALHMDYGMHLELRLLTPETLGPVAGKIVEPLRGKAITDIADLAQRVQDLERCGEAVLIYPDTEEYIERQLFQRHMLELVNSIRAGPEQHPLRDSLLKVSLLPYQLDGIAFAAGAGRAILADDMGLGKTIQGIGVAELLAREADIGRVLVVCPASLKSQWRQEIGRFCERSSQIVMGSALERANHYQQPTFFSICNYEQVLRDAPVIAEQKWDLIILDEGQRIKNWQAKTSQIIKSLRSTYALVLTGTPLENRLDDLYSIVEFIDDRRLGPGFRFYNHHRVVDEKGKVLGYKNLTELKRKLAPILLRRTRASVMQQLPARSTEIIRVAPTEEQADIHSGHSRTIQSIINKRYLNEMDLLRLQKALLMCRMCADSTYLVDKQAPGYSSKLEALEILLSDLAREADRKIILFSEWTTMLDLIEPILQQQGIDRVRLDGKVVQKKRQQLVNRFQNDADCRLFMTTNAGATGLNLQAANTVINVDLPWNPALLEQRIARAHRMGQKRQVQVYILVTNDTLEENLLTTLSVKKELALAALDPDTNVDSVDFQSGMEELKKRLEILLGVAPDANIDASMLQKEQQELARQQRLADAGGQLLSAAFGFLNEMLPASDENKLEQLSEQLSGQLQENLTAAEDGSFELKFKLPDQQALHQLSSVMAKLIIAGEKQ